MLTMVLFALLTIIILPINIANGLLRIDPLVNSKVGLIRGITSNDGDYSMFMGIPYGQVNAINPFGDATPFPIFEDTYNAFDDSAICPQVYQFNNTILGSLNCLHLNIYVPSTATSVNRLPVMVWLYGGSFRRGFSGRLMFGPGFIMKHNVILVTVNYRVGPYGFMCLDVPEVSGNQGLKDQLMALRWINENIQSFGGDVNQITLFGESAGGHSVDLHLLSPKEKLYNKAILQSGSAQAATVLLQPEKNAHFKLANYLGLNTTDVNEALSFLSTADTNLVIAASVELEILFKPCVESEFDGVDAFITESWVTSKVPKVANMPILLGFNEDELMVNHENKNSEHFKNLDIFARYLSQTFNFNDEDFNTMHEVVRHFYLGDEPLSENMKQEIINFDSDYTYIHPIQRTISKYVESNSSNIFYYMFAYDGRRNFYKKSLNITYKGAGHADELGYLFDMQWLTDDITQEDQLIIDRMTTMWTNFAKFSSESEIEWKLMRDCLFVTDNPWKGWTDFGDTFLIDSRTYPGNLGDPTPQTSALLPIKWIPIREDSLNYLRIDKEMSLGTRPLNDRMAFWDLFYKLNEQFQIDFK